jgi:hypothetical protein
MEKWSMTKRRSLHNGIAFLSFSILFFVYWILFLVFGLNHHRDNLTLYIILTSFELLVNVAMIVFAILSMRRSNRISYSRFFVLDWVLLAIGTFPMPFTYLLGMGYQNNTAANEISAIATPTCVLSFLALVFALASYLELPNSKIHKGLLNLAVISLGCASLYVFLCFLYKVATATNPEGYLNNIYVYCALAGSYILLCIYGLVSIHRELELLPSENKRSINKKSLFSLTSAAFLGYGILGLATSIYGFSNALRTNLTIISVPFGQASPSAQIGDQLFLLFTRLGIVIFSFYLIRKKKDTTSLFGFAVLLSLFSLSFLIPSLVGSYGFISTYLTSSETVATNISFTFSLATFSAMAFGTAIAGLFLSENRRKLSALYLAVSAFMICGVYAIELGGLLYQWISSGLNWFTGLLNVVISLPDLAVSIISLIALAREYPATKEVPYESLN